MPNLLNASSVMMCPHGGTVQAATSNTHTKVGGDFALRASDTFTIAGCAFMLGSSPHPCMSIQWVQTDTRSQVSSDFTLNEASVGLCVAADQAPQGTVLITSTQTRTGGL